MYGKDYKQNTHPIGFHILYKENEDVMDLSLPPPYGKNWKKGGKVDFMKMKIQTEIQTKAHWEDSDLDVMEDQAMYKFNHATSCWCTLKKGRYLIVPSTYKRPTKEELELGAGPFHLSVFGCAEEGNGLESWELIDAEALNLENKENNIQGQQETLSSTQNLKNNRRKMHS